MIPGVDVEIKEPQVIDIIDPEIPPTDLDPIEPAPLHQADEVVEPMSAMHQVEPELCRSCRFMTKTNKYTRSMSDSK